VAHGGGAGGGRAAAVQVRMMCECMRVRLCVSGC
jgi:hypothetical protein